ncbi:uncharacterized protein [Dendropsophus ebraccatus]|uniref:uncharacterized protein n=1 Tax=Dendropsophus ebraccatus TaxID=150705 RepID=UPI0038314844
MDGSRFVKQAGQGSYDMARAYLDMREANYKNSDLLFHARGNYDAAQRGSGGVWAAMIINDLREQYQPNSGRGEEDSKADQIANRWGHSGGDPKRFMPKGLSEKYWKKQHSSHDRDCCVLQLPEAGVTEEKSWDRPEASRTARRLRGDQCRPQREEISADPTERSGAQITADPRETSGPHITTRTRPSHHFPMKLSVLLLLVLSVAVTQAQLSQWIKDTGRNIRDGARFVKEAGQGSWDMARAYMDMRDANYKNADKYFHARGNYDAAQRGSGGVWASRVISDAREDFQSNSGRGAEDSAADQKANHWGRSGGDPNHFRPEGLPKKY